MLHTRAHSLCPVCVGIDHEKTFGLLKGEYYTLLAFSDQV